MNKRKKKIFNLKYSLLLLLLTSVFLVASSYAWFTSNQTVSVNSLQVNVEAKNGLQISVDGTNWKSIIQPEDIKGANATYAASKNQLPSALGPVSTAGNIDTTTGFLDMFFGNVGTNADGDYILSSVKQSDTDGTTGQYIAFDLFFRVDKDTPVYLTTASGATFADPTSKGMENAARIAFVNQGNVPTGSDLVTIQGLKGATNATTYIWEPNYDVHTAPAIANAMNTYGITTTQEGAAAIVYDGIKADIAESKNVLLGQANKATHADLFETVTPTHKTVKNFTANLSLFTLKAGITKIRMYMWIEGQDVDCENTASGSNIKYDIQITSTTP